MKSYKIDVELKIEEQNSYQKVGFLVKLQEHVPEGQDPVEYLRKRVSEEYKRHAPHAKLEWKNPEEVVKQEEDAIPY